MVGNIGLPDPLLCGDAPYSVSDYGVKMLRHASQCDDFRTPCQVESSLKARRCAAQRTFCYATCANVTETDTLGAMTTGAQTKRKTAAIAKVVAENLSAELARRGMSDRDAARRLGLTNAYVSRRANGSVEMTVSDIDLFAGFLGIPVTRLLEDRDAVAVRKLPELDSNQQPIGSQSALVTSLSDRIRKTPQVARSTPAIVSLIGAHA